MVAPKRFRRWTDTERELIVKQICSTVKAGKAREVALHQALMDPRVMRRSEFCQDHIRIADKHTAVWGPWNWNRPQRIVEATRLRFQRAKRPERYVTLKARKWGLSTLWLGYGIEAATRCPGTNCVIIADQASDANALLETGRIMVQSLPFALPLKYSNRSVIYFDKPIYSRVDIETAQNDDPCRGRTVRFIHCTEPQLYKDPEKKAIAFEQAVSDQPGTVISYEGTGYGINWWHDFYMKVWNGEMPAWHAFFFPWWYDKGFDYNKPLRKGEGAALLSELDDEERELLRIGVDAGQLAWRRDKIRNSFRGNLDLFHQEFPSTPREAFLASGRPAFVSGHVYRTLARAREPLERLRVATKVSDDTLEVSWLEDPEGECTIWSKPVRDARYIIGIDTGNGVAGGDPSAAIVIDARSCEQVARLYADPGPKGKRVVHPKEFGHKCVALAKLYNNALFMPEIEGPGSAVLNAARDVKYNNIGRRESFDKAGRISIEKLGWSTNSVSRGAMFNEVREHLALNDDGGQFHDRDLALEMLSMVVDEDMREDHPPGGHDDLVVAWAIALVTRRTALRHGIIRYEERRENLTESERHWREFEESLAAQVAADPNEEITFHDYD